MKQHNGMRPHDIVVLLKIITLGGDFLNKDLARTLFISTSEISESLNRSKIAGLIDERKKKVMKNNLLDFIIYGLPFVFPVKPQGPARGIPTAHSAPILYKLIVSNESLVWPYKDGIERGYAVQPLYPNAVKAALSDEKLYDMLALVDVLRIGKVREKSIASDKLRYLIKNEYEY